MILTEKELFNELRPETNKVLISKEQLEEYNNLSEEEKESFEITKSTIIYLPKQLDYEWCKNNYIEE